jgi:multidrug resistance efflux pump
MNAQVIDVPAVPPPAPSAPAPSAPPVPAPSAPPAPHVWTPPRRRMRMIALTVLLAAGALLAVLAAWDLPPFAGGLEKTDNAYVRGLTMNVAPQVTGYVVAVQVKDYEQVRAGQVLARIDDRIYTARVARQSQRTARGIGECACSAVAGAVGHGSRE